ncbi:alpha/beta hydrolase [Psychrobacter sp.]|uniref:alpha/beta hydrolase n=1 Tax=Psychrobacter sp. TaxID=56811 RepID=UPI003F9D773D
MSSNKLISEKIEFPIHGEFIRGTLYLPSNHTTNKLPGVVLAHGWAMTAGGDLEDYAQIIAQHNIICLTIDFRNLGASTGQPRQHLDPHQQIEDLRSPLWQDSCHP